MFTAAIALAQQFVLPALAAYAPKIVQLGAQAVRLLPHVIPHAIKYVRNLIARGAPKAARIMRRLVGHIRKVIRVYARKIARAPIARKIIRVMTAIPRGIGHVFRIIRGGIVAAVRAGGRFVRSIATKAYRVLRRAWRAIHTFKRKLIHGAARLLRRAGTLIKKFVARLAKIPVGIREFVLAVFRKARKAIQRLLGFVKRIPPEKLETVARKTERVLARIQYTLNVAEAYARRAYSAYKVGGIGAALEVVNEAARDLYPQFQGIASDVQSIFADVGELAGAQYAQKAETPTSVSIAQAVAPMMQIMPMILMVKMLPALFKGLAR